MLKLLTPPLKEIKCLWLLVNRPFLYMWWEEFWLGAWISTLQYRSWHEQTLGHTVRSLLCILQQRAVQVSKHSQLDASARWDDHVYGYRIWSNQSFVHSCDLWRMTPKIIGPHIYVYSPTYLYIPKQAWTVPSLSKGSSRTAMPGAEPEVRGFARMVANGVGALNCHQSEVDVGIIFERTCQTFVACMVPLMPKPCNQVKWCPPFVAMALKRTTSSFYEDELRDLLTYVCPITGKSRCPPYKKPKYPGHN